MHPGAVDLPGFSRIVIQQRLDLVIQLRLRRDSVRRELRLDRSGILRHSSLQYGI